MNHKVEYTRDVFVYMHIKLLKNDRVVGMEYQLRAMEDQKSEEK